MRVICLALVAVSLAAAASAGERKMATSADKVPGLIQLSVP
jgi:hypothetical protein